MPVANNNHKDRLFCAIFGSDENREWTLSLYNAVNQSHYTDATQIQFTTIKNIMYMGMRNDVSFIIANEMNLYEHQSTYNPNMPIRLLQYYSHLIGKYIAENNINVFADTTVKLPVPKFVVFYNGTRSQPEETVLKLSDAFPANANADVEVTVRMINVNYGHSAQIQKDCKVLREYSWLIDAIRRKNTTKDKEGLLKAIDEAINEMPDDFVIKPYLKAHQVEVKGMLLTEFNEAETLRIVGNDNFKRGRAEGLDEGIVRSIRGAMKSFNLTEKEAMKGLDIPESDWSRYSELLKS